MAGFLYYLPNREGGDITDLGLDFAFDRRHHRPVHAGPAGGPAGSIVADISVDITAIAFHPDKQTWRQIVGSEAHVGYYTASPPKPADLARRNQLPGQWLELPDGHQYQIPVARRWQEFEGRLLYSVAFPQALRRNDSGQWIPDGVVAKYARLWDMLQGYLAARDAALADADTGETVTFTFEQIDDVAIGALQLNYRLGPDELELLGLYTSDIRSQILRILVDDATRETWLQKKIAELVPAGGDS